MSKIITLEQQICLKKFMRAGRTPVRMHVAEKQQLEERFEVTGKTSKWGYY